MPFILLQYILCSPCSLVRTKFPNRVIYRAHGRLIGPPWMFRYPDYFVNLHHCALWDAWTPLLYTFLPSSASTRCPTVSKNGISGCFARKRTESAAAGGGRKPALFKVSSSWKSSA